MTTRRGLVIQPDGSSEIKLIHSYLDIREAVGGDFDWASPGPVNYYCYEYALFERPVNPVATILYRGTHDTTDPMCGAVLVTGPVRDEDDTDVPEEIVVQVREIRERLGQDHIDAQAVPLTAAEQTAFQMQMIAAQGQATEALQQGRGVDFGGIYMGAEPTDPAPLDGNRRQGKRR
jgi:hypothetical protein